MSEARALVFGGTGRLGSAVVRELAGQGARVAFTWHQDQAGAEALCRAVPGSVALQLEAGSVASVEQVVAEAAERLGGLTCFAHCAAVGVTVRCEGDASPHRLPAIDEAGWDRMLAVNAKSAFFALRALLPHLQAAGGGNVVLVGSIDGIKPVPAPVHYAASKGAVAAMVATLAKELGGQGVRVNSVAPGVLEGGISRTLPPELVTEYEKHCGLKRRGRFDEVAPLVCWLLLENTYLSGQSVVLDGAL